MLPVGVYPLGILTLTMIQARASVFFYLQNSKMSILSIAPLHLLLLFAFISNGATSYSQSVPDSILSGDRVLYVLPQALAINNFTISDTFVLVHGLKLIGEPDTTVFGGEKIIEEFGADDYFLAYGKSYIYAGHGYILAMRIIDRNLCISGCRIGDSRRKVKKRLKINFPDAEVVSFICFPDDGVFVFQFDDRGKLIEMEYYSAPL